MVDLRKEAWQLLRSQGVPMPVCVAVRRSGQDVPLPRFPRVCLQEAIKLKHMSTLMHFYIKSSPRLPPQSHVHLIP